MVEKERIDSFVKRVLQYSSCSECKKKFLQYRPAIVKIINGHIHPISYVHWCDNIFRLKVYESLCGIPVPGAYYSKLIAVTKFLLRVEFAEKLFREKPEFFRGKYPTIEDLSDNEFSAILIEATLIADL